ncbi:MAG: hypothetical protein AUI14_14430 [Actinobacteria bacterium 13_2_20CM_2_71_6]|nr:MAG: hypothetical protein AUI14_14430 [Actinobacteria bacterium 13_2_20CM_2_71_6]
MSLTFEQIPDHDRPTGEGGTGRFAKSTALKDLKVTGGRRTVLRAVALGAMTIGATALDWAGAFGTRGARAEFGPYAMQGWDRNDCRDAYPSGYAEVGDTNGLYVNRYAACFGGSFRGSTYCNAGWHKYGTWYDNGIQADHTPISSSCGATTTRNAWRWTTPDGIVYRCSDGFTTFWGGGYTGQTYLTVCRSTLAP